MLPGICVLYIFRRSKMAVGQFIMGFSRTVFGSSLFVHVESLRLRLLLCVGSIGACPENRILSPYIQDGRPLN